MVRGCETIEEVKARYKELVFTYHPDKSGRDTNGEMAEITSQYKDAAAKYKNVHKTVQGETYEKETPDTAAEFADIIEKIIRLEGVTIEICGSWVWISGGTKQYKDYLKESGFRWSANKAAWYWHREPYKRRSRKNYTLDEIRTMHGSQAIRADEDEQHRIAQ